MTKSKKKGRKSITGTGRDLPPLAYHVEIYFIQKGYSIPDATGFYAHFAKKGWENVKDWKAEAFHWIFKIEKEKKFLC